MRPLLLLLALSLGACPGTLAAATLTPAEVERSIERDGARAVVSRLAQSGDYERLLLRIDKGDPRWIALAPKLAAGVDGGNAESLVIALAFALPRNAGAVLAVLSPESLLLSPGEVCSAPFIEDTVKDIPRYRRNAAAALRRVSDPRLRAIKAACLAELRKP